MSWEIFISDLPAVPSIREVPADHVPRPIGDREALVERIRQVLPLAERVDKDWLFVKGQGMDLSLQLHMENAREVRYIVVHVHDDAEGARAVAALLRHLDLRGHDTATGEFFDGDTLEENL